MFIIYIYIELSMAKKYIGDFKHLVNRILRFHYTMLYNILNYMSKGKYN